MSIEALGNSETVYEIALTSAERHTIQALQDGASDKAKANPRLTALDYDPRAYPWQHPMESFVPLNPNIRFQNEQGEFERASVDITQMTEWGQLVNPRMEEGMIKPWFEPGITGEKLVTEVVNRLADGENVAFVSSHQDHNDPALNLCGFQNAVHRELGIDAATFVKEHSLAIYSKEVAFLQSLITIGNRVIKASMPEVSATGAWIFLTIPRSDSVRNRNIDLGVQDSMNRKFARSYIRMRQEIRSDGGGSLLMVAPSGSINISEKNPDGEIISITLKKAAGESLGLIKDSTCYPIINYPHTKFGKGLDCYIGKPQLIRGKKGLDAQILHATMDEMARFTEYKTGVPTYYQ